MNMQHGWRALQCTLLPQCELCEVREFGQGGLEVICSSLRHYPGEQRVGVWTHIAVMGRGALDALREEVNAGLREPQQPRANHSA
jgi:hypothetical protein